MNPTPNSPHAFPRQEVGSEQKWALPRVNEGKAQRLEMVTGLLLYNVNYSGRKEFVAFCLDNLRFTGDWQDFIFRRDLLEEFWKFCGGKKSSPVPVGMHLAAAGVKATRLGKEMNQEYGYSGVCFVDGRARKYFPKKRPRSRPKKAGRWAAMQQPASSRSAATQATQDDSGASTDSSVDSCFSRDSTTTEDSPPDNSFRAPRAPLPSHGTRNPQHGTSSSSWMEPWKPPVPFNPYQVPIPPTTTTETPRIPDYNPHVSRTPDTSQIQPPTAAASSWLHTWDCGKVTAAHDKSAPHSFAALSLGTQNTNPGRLHTSTGSVQYLTEPSPWICAWSPLLLQPSVNPSPNTPAPPSRPPNGTAGVGGAVECLSVQPGVKTDHQEDLGIKAEI